MKRMNTYYDGNCSSMKLSNIEQKTETKRNERKTDADNAKCNLYKRNLYQVTGQNI